MNPENNNPFSNSGLGSTSPAGAGTPPLNMTTPTNSMNGGLSMADSMASAQDNLTAAGLASPSTSNVMGLDQIGATSPSAMMTPPADDPLVPAAPVPGSIGSVTSMPMTSTPTSPAVMDATQSTPAATQPTVQSNAASSMFSPVAPEVANPTQADTAAPYNPFAKPAANTTAPATATATTGSAAKAPTTPGAFQPAAVAKKVSLKDKMGGDKFKNPLVLILCGIIAVLAVALIVFIILFINALNNKEYIYMPSPNNPETARREVLTCTRQIAGEEIGKAGAVWGDTEIVADYENDDLTNIKSVNRVTFDSPDAANVARGEYEASLWERANANGGNLDGEVLVEGAVVTMNVRATKDTAGMILSGKIVETTNEEGEVVNGIQVDTNLDAVQAEFVNQGFGCNIVQQ